MLGAVDGGGLFACLGVLVGSVVDVVGGFEERKGERGGVKMWQERMFGQGRLSTALYPGYGVNES